MPGIGAFTFIALSGSVNPGNGEQLENITRKGVDGVSFRKTGKRSRPFALKSIVDVANAAAAKSLMIDYKSAQGSVVTVDDAYGQTWNNIVIERVDLHPPRFIQSKTGGLDSGESGYMVEATWILQATETA